MSVASVSKHISTTPFLSSTSGPSNLNENKSIYFKHSPEPTDKKLVLKFQDQNYRFSLQIIKIYFLYRNAVFNSYSIYKEKGSLHQDILDFNKQRQYEPETSLEKESLFQYSIKAAKGAAKSWKTGEVEGAQTNCFLAYHQNNQIGFVQFCKLKDPLTSKEVVYIAELGVDSNWQRQGIAKNLMLKVMNNHPSQTTFYVLTRKFNVAAENLYLKLGFSQFLENEESIIEHLGYNKTLYNGYKIIT